MFVSLKRKFYFAKVAQIDNSFRREKRRVEREKERKKTYLWCLSILGRSNLKEKRETFNLYLYFPMLVWCFYVLICKFYVAIDNISFWIPKIILLLLLLRYLLLQHEKFTWKLTNNLADLEILWRQQEGGTLPDSIILKVYP